jgi:hypothetical protein
MPPNGGNPWYDPGSSYGSSQNWFTTPFSRDYMSPQVPQGEFMAYLSNNGLGGFDRASQFGQSLYGKSQSGWQAAKLNNPELSYRDYLNQYLGGNGIRNIWAGMSPDQRGEQPGRYMGHATFRGRG